MPELPEVEAARRALEEHAKGKLIVRAVVADDSKVITGVEPLQLQQSLAGKRIINVNRKGKNMWLELDERPWPTFQFGMAGAIHIKGGQTVKYKRAVTADDDEWPPKYSKVLAELEDGQEFSFSDVRRFARIRLIEDPKTSPPISELGPDAYLELPSEEGFLTLLRAKKGSIKALLLDQSFLSGIGNWVADEALYQAKIHPEQVASSLSDEQSSTLRDTIKKVLEFAVHVNADSAQFPSDWIFHNRWGKKPGSVNAIEVGADSSQYPDNWIFHIRDKKAAKASGKKIDFIKVGGRTSAYVPELQKLTGPLEVEKPPRKRASSRKGDIQSESEDNSEKAQPKGGRKRRAKKKEAETESSDEDEDEDQEEDEEDSAAVTAGTRKGRSRSAKKEDTSEEPLKKGRATKGKTIATGQEKAAVTEKEPVLGGARASARQHSLASRSASVVRGYRTACNPRTTSPVWSRQFSSLQAFGAYGCVQEICPAAAFSNTTSCVQRRWGTCSIRKLDEERALGKVKLHVHQVRNLTVGLRACMSLLRRPACLV